MFPSNEEDNDNGLSGSINGYATDGMNGPSSPVYIDDGLSTLLLSRLSETPHVSYMTSEMPLFPLPHLSATSASTSTSTSDYVFHQITATPPPPLLLLLQAFFGSIATPPESIPQTESAVGLLPAASLVEDASVDIRALDRSLTEPVVSALRLELDSNSGLELGSKAGFEPCSEPKSAGSIANEPPHNSATIVSDQIPNRTLDRSHEMEATAEAEIQPEPNIQPGPDTGAENVNARMLFQSETSRSDTNKPEPELQNESKSNLKPAARSLFSTLQAFGISASLPQRKIAASSTAFNVSVSPSSVAKDSAKEMRERENGTGRETCERANIDICEEARSAERTVVRDEAGEGLQGGEREGERESRVMVGCGRRVTAASVARSRRLTAIPRAPPRPLFQALSRSLQSQIGGEAGMM